MSFFKFREKYFYSYKDPKTTKSWLLKIWYNIIFTYFVIETKSKIYVCQSTKKRPNLYMTILFCLCIASVWQICFISMSTKNDRWKYSFSCQNFQWRKYIEINSLFDSFLFQTFSNSLRKAQNWHLRRRMNIFVFGCWNWLVNFSSHQMNSVFIVVACIYVFLSYKNDKIY